MATNFNNKYLQVLQNYDEFGEYSADYVKGEDHVAFLIEENEVIYWLYLEQVWRPLNVRTTKTGELEDGRTKVAVKLEYVEGGQKYTSVPNIPDPERITSMSHFLENYPDIEEVNVNGTVNLTDLSYAFANSKIKDFSMLDTSNVTNIEGIIDNVNDNKLNIHINYKSCTPTNGNPIFDNIVLNELKLYQLELTPVSRSIDIYDSTINKLIAIDQSINVYNVIINEIESNEYIGISHDSVTNRISQINNVTADEIKIFPYALIDDNIINIQFNKLEITGSNFNNYNWANKIICLPNNNECTILFNFNINRRYSFAFGYGIDYNNLPNVILTIANDTIIGNFCFTIPIVNDEFINKYNNAKQISIFQYKTTFTEVADVNISKNIDPNLVYIDWPNINFDLSNTSIELYNNININTEHYSANIKKLIIDNSNVDGINKENCPYLHDFYSNRINATEGHISGIFKSYNIYNESYARIRESNLLKNITLVDFIYIFIYNGDFLKTNNIKFDYVKCDKYIALSVEGNKLTELDTLINNNHIGVNLRCNYSGDDVYSRRIKNIDGVIFDIGNSIEDTYTNIYFIIDLLFEGNNNNINGTISIGSGSPNNEQISESVYINGNSKLIEFHSTNHNNEYNYVKYIYGNNLTIRLDMGRYTANNDWSLASYKHVDINAVITETYSNEYHIFSFINSDEETTINLITKLIDNTGNSSKTIYMYRSQANIIGEENIAAAVAKNYEFAIIEN